MIGSFRHKGLGELFQTENKRGIPPELAERISRRLDVLDAAQELGDVDAHGFNLHQLKGDRRGGMGNLGEWELEDHFQVHEG